MGGEIISAMIDEGFSLLRAEFYRHCLDDPRGNLILQRKGIR